MHVCMYISIRNIRQKKFSSKIAFDGVFPSVHAYYSEAPKKWTERGIKIDENENSAYRMV